MGTIPMYPSPSFPAEPIISVVKWALMPSPVGQIRCLGKRGGVTSYGTEFSCWFSSLVFTCWSLLSMGVKAGLTCLETGRLKLLVENVDSEFMTGRLNQEELWLLKGKLNRRHEFRFSPLVKDRLRLLEELSLFPSWDFMLCLGQGLGGTKGIFLDCSFSKGSEAMWSWRYHQC